MMKRIGSVAKQGSDGRWRIVAEPGLLLTSWVLLASGGMIGAVVVWLWIAGLRVESLGILPPAAALVAGAWLRYTVVVSLLDPTEGVLERREIRWTTRDVAAVALGPAIVSEPTDGDHVRVRKWWVTLLEIQRERQQPASDRARSGLGDDVLRILKAASSDVEPILITAVTEEQHAVSVAWLLAEAFDVPLVDTTSTELATKPENLGRPLVESAARGALDPDDPGPPPAKVRAHESDDGLRLEWFVPQSRWPLVLLLAFALALGANVIMAMVMLPPGEFLSAPPWVLLGMVTGVVGPLLLVLGLIAYEMRGSGPNVLQLTASEIRSTTSRPIRRVKVVRLDDVCRIRQYDHPKPHVSIIGRDVVLKLRCEAQVGVWLRAKLEHWIAVTGRGRAGVGGSAEP